MVKPYYVAACGLANRRGKRQCLAKPQAARGSFTPLPYLSSLSSLPFLSTQTAKSLSSARSQGRCYYRPPVFGEDSMSTAQSPSPRRSLATPTALVLGSALAGLVLWCIHYGPLYDPQLVRYTHHPAEQAS